METLFAEIKDGKVLRVIVVDPSKSNLRRHTREELDEMVIRLAEAHDIRV